MTIITLLLTSARLGSNHLLDQEMFVEHLRTKYGDKVADWCRDFWTGERASMCLAQNQYAWCNNNMGVEVSWHLIKEICSGLASLSQFIGALCSSAASFEISIRTACVQPFAVNKRFHSRPESDQRNV